MRAAGIASRAVRAWAITPVGARALISTSRVQLSRIQLSVHARHLHPSPIRSLNAEASSAVAETSPSHLPLPATASQSTTIDASLKNRDVGLSRRQRLRERQRRRKQLELEAARDYDAQAQNATAPAGTFTVQGTKSPPSDVASPPQLASRSDPRVPTPLPSPIPEDVSTSSERSGDPASSQVTTSRDGSAVGATAKESRAEKRRAKRVRYLERRKTRRQGSAKPAMAPPKSAKTTAKDTKANKAVEVPADGARLALRTPKKEDLIERGSMAASDVELNEIKPERPMKIAQLRSDLARVLFSPGVHHLRDPRCGVRNFGASLDHIPKAEDFAVERTPTYVPPSQHQELLDLASKSKARFIGSTSTLTKAFSQIWFTINGGRELDFSKFSQDFANSNTTYTHGAELPAVLVLAPLEGQSDNGDKVWAVDSDKAYDIENALSDYGRVLEKQLTAEDADFARFLRSAPDSAVSQEERNEAEAYRFRTAGSILMRSQLDCHDARLPGTGVFDIKTRACHPLRHDRANVEQASGHDVYRERGMGNTFERELYDLVRSAMLKFSMQVRIGDMDGIFLAYHNTARMFGFQYLPLSDMDEYLFGSTQLADQAFNLSIAIFERIIKHVTETVGGDEPISLLLYHTPRSTGPLNIYFGPASQDRPTHAVRLRTTNKVDGSEIQGPITFGDKPRGKQWTIDYSFSKIPIDDAQHGFKSCIDLLKAMCTLTVPDGKTVGEMNELEKAKSRGAVVAVGGEGAVEDVLLEGEISGSETRSAAVEDGEQVGEHGEAGTAGGGAAGETKVKAASDRSKVRVRWVTPNGRIQALRKEVEASKGLYEERKKGWNEDP